MDEIMKETKNKSWNKEQKIYALFLGIGLCALAAVTLVYGWRNFRTNSMVEQKVQLGEEGNPVSGPVADQNIGTEEKNKETDTTDNTEKVSAVTERRNDKNSFTEENGYNGKEQAEGYQGTYGSSSCLLLSHSL